MEAKRLFYIKLQPGKRSHGNQKIVLHQATARKVLPWKPKDCSTSSYSEESAPMETKRLFYIKLQQGKCSHGTQKKRFRHALKKNPQKQSALTVEANCSPTRPNGVSPFTEVSHDARPRRRPQQGNGSRPSKPEPVTFYQTFLPSSVCTAGEPSVHRLALRAICTPTNRPSLPPPLPGPSDG